MPEATRRDALRSLGAAAVATWAAQGIDPENISPEDRTEGAAGYTVETFEPRYVGASVTGPLADVAVHEELTDYELGVYYDSDQVNIDLEGSAEDRRGGALAIIDPDQARQVALAVFMAAEEVKRWSR